MTISGGNLRKFQGHSMIEIFHIIAGLKYQLDVTHAFVTRSFGKYS